MPRHKHPALNHVNTYMYRSYTLSVCTPYYPGGTIQIKISDLRDLVLLVAQHCALHITQTKQSRVGLRVARARPRHCRDTAASSDFGSWETSYGSMHVLYMYGAYRQKEIRRKADSAHVKGIYVASPMQHRRLKKLHAGLQMVCGGCECHVPNLRVSG